MKLRRSLPEAVRAVSDRRLAWGVTDDRIALVATPTCLHVGGEQIDWTSVEKVGWVAPLLRLTEMAEVEGTGLVHLWELAENHGLAETIRERVTASVAWSDVRKLHPSGAVRLVGRRVPGQELLTWQTVWQSGTDPSDPLLRAQAEAYVEDLRKSIG